MVFVTENTFSQAARSRSTVITATSVSYGKNGKFHSL